MKFVLHLCDKINWFSLIMHSGLRSSWRQIRYACGTHPWPDYTICNFQSRAKFVFSLHDTRMKFRTRMRISFRMKTGVNSFWNDLYWKKISSQYHVNRCKEIFYGDGMNSFLTESYSGISKQFPIHLTKPMQRKGRDGKKTAKND